MWVKALEVGYFGTLREPGEVFEIESKKQLGSWMEEIEEPEGGASAPPEPSKEGTLAELDKPTVMNIQDVPMTTKSKRNRKPPSERDVAK